MASDTSNPPDRDDGSGRIHASGSGDGTGPELDRLPPPAFPPGSRRSSALRAGRKPDDEAPAGGGGGDADFPEDALISPDDPIRKEGRGIPDDAFISPDDPLESVDRDEEGRVTGMGELAESVGESLGSRQKPSIHELPYLLNELAERISDAGEGALEVRAEMGHFQAALRSFLKGYIQGGSG